MSGPRIPRGTIALNSTSRWLLADTTGAPGTQGPPRGESWGGHVLFALAYSIAVAASFSTVYSGTNIAIIWPPVGIAVWWVATCRSWRAFAVVSGVVALVPTIRWSLIDDVSAVAVLFIALSNLVEAPLVALAMRYFERVRPTEPMHDAGAVRSGPGFGISTAQHVYRLLIAAIVSVALAKGVILLALTQQGEPVTLTFYASLVLRDLAGIIAIAGCALAISSAVVRTMETKVLREFAGVLALTAVVLVLVFALGPRLPIVYLVMLPLYWGATKLPVLLATVHVELTIAATVVLIFVVGAEPFAVNDESPLARSTAIQLFIILCILLTLVVSTTVQQHSGLVEELEVLARTIPDAFLIVNGCGKAFPVNEAARDFVVRSDDGDGFVVRRLLDLDGETFDDGNRPSSRALRGESVEGTLVQVADTADDTTGQPSRVFMVSAAPLYLHGAASPGHALVLLHDSTDEYRTVQDLIRAHDAAQLLFENAPQGVATLDQSGVIITANSAIGELLDTPTDLLRGRRLDDFSTEPGLIEELCHEAVDAGEVVHTDRVFVTASGRRRNVALSFRAVRAGENQTSSLFVNAVDVTERQRLHDLVTHLADHDSLTGLANRRRLEAEVERMVEMSGQDVGDGALMMIDLDNFKQVNDVLGHHVGDQLLVEFGRLLTDHVRADDLVGRLGGDEFVVVLPDTDREAVEAISRRIMEAVAERFGERPDEVGRITASIGFTMFSEAREQGSDPFLLADRLLYDAKHAGKNRVASAMAADPPALPGALRISPADLRGVLESDALRIDLQPILDLSTGEIALAEGLLRIGPGGPAVSTVDLVGAAEQTGLSSDLDVRVLRMGIAALRTLLEHRPDFRLSVNISAQSLGSSSVRTLFAEELEKQQFPQGALILEVTETAELKDLDAARAFQRTMWELGAVFAIDDFGAGYAPFRYLSHLEFQYLKIGGEFVQGAVDSETDTRIVRSLSRLGRDQGMPTIAEHVSSAAVLEKVCDCGISFAQGFHIGAAVPLDEFISTHLESEKSQPDQVMKKNV